MNKDKLWLKEVATKYCLPAMEKALNDYKNNKQYTAIDCVGYAVTRLEALLRPLWGFAPLFKTGEKFNINLNGEKCELSNQIRHIILEGTDEKSDMCFSKFAEKTGTESFANQAITEIAGYMVAVMFAPDALWEPYSEREKEKISAWIKKWAVIALENSWPNNHYWFPMITVTILEKIGIDCGDVEKDMQKGFKVLESMYIKNGWYMDGEFGRFDYYLAWSHHVYPILWSIASENTRFYDEEKVKQYRKRTEGFFDYYTHLFDSNGAYVPFGRSLAYRFAASSLCGAAVLGRCKVNMGLCKEILLRNVKYFVDNCVPTDDGTLPPGYLYDSHGIVENYTSQGGAYWCSKAFLALLIEDEHPFWTEPSEKLPIECADFVIDSPVENINMILEGSDEYSGITLYNNTASYYQEVFTHNFNDMASYYSKFVYNSRSGFGISSADKPSLDNMISLSTQDGTMYSIRKGFKNLGYINGALVSEHIPFSNDAKTKIKTWLIPLGNGHHVKAHSVDLGQSYRITEGGFSVGLYNDNHNNVIEKNSCTVMDNNGKQSRLSVFTDQNIKYTVLRHHHGMHILAPQSEYPAYTTDVLEKGTYYFATLCSFTDNISFPELPCVKLCGNVLKIRYGKKNKHFVLE